MNSRIEPRFRDTDDARGKLVGLTSGVGFRLLVKQALAPGEPLQIDIGDGNLLVLARYRLPVELGHSFGADGMADGLDDRRRRDAAISADEAFGQDAAGRAASLQIEEDRGPAGTAAVRDTALAKSSVRDRRGLALMGIAAAIILSALGILWGGIGGEHGIASLPAFREPTKAAARTIEKTAPVAKTSVEAPGAASRVPQPSGLVSPTAATLRRNVTAEAPKPALASIALPVAAIARVKAAPVAIASAPLAPVSKVMADSGTGLVRSISIKASDLAWVTACADGVKVFGKVFNKGDNAEVRFSSRAEVHSANAGAIELTMGDQSIGLMGRWGQVRTINATPAGYEFVAALPARNCGNTSPAN